MLTWPDRRERRGVTLLELLVTMVVGGLALALIASVSLRQQRIFSDMTEAAALSSQLREASTILPIDVRALASGAGDIREARDTALDIRATIASAVVCDTSAGGVVLAPRTTGAGTYAGYLTAIEAGDTAWVLTASDSSEAWKPYRVAMSQASPPGDCVSPAPAQSDSGRTVPRVAIRFDDTTATEAIRAAVGMPLRVTRPLRYSLYRGSDGSWYLGARDWNNATARFNTIQPVSGPFLSPVAGGLRFRYMDSVASELAAPVADTHAIALILIELRGQTRHPPRVLGGAASRVPRVDSVSAMVLLHNRR